MAVSSPSVQISVHTCTFSVKSGCIVPLYTGADKNLRYVMFFKWMKSNWIGTNLKPKGEEKVILVTILAVIVGTLFAFLEVNCTLFPLSLHRLRSLTGRCVSLLPQGRNFRQLTMPVDNFLIVS